MVDSENISSKVPKFNGKNYTIWKIRMRVYIQALGDDAYGQSESRYVAPTIKVPITATLGARIESKLGVDYKNAEYI